MPKARTLFAQRNVPQFFKSRGLHFHVRRRQGADDCGRNRVVRHEPVRLAGGLQILETPALARLTAQKCPATPVNWRSARLNAAITLRLA